MLLEYQLDWIKIVDFLLIAKFWASPNNFDSPSTSFDGLVFIQVKTYPPHFCTRGCEQLPNVKTMGTIFPGHPALEQI